MKLVIAEKPSVASGIAKVIGATKAEQGFIIGNNYIVSWCVGHLVTLAEPSAYDEKYSKWDLKDLPIIPEQFKTQVLKSTSSQFKILKQLMERSDVDELICATDAGREGELIFRLVYEKAKCKKPFKRLWISSMEESAIREGFKNLKNGNEYNNLYAAAQGRQQADWLVGINFSRLFSLLYNCRLSIGRVQTPVVNIIVKRQQEIKDFIPKKYYVVTADFDSFSAKLKTEEKHIADTVLGQCEGKNAVVTEVEEKTHKKNAPALYDLTTLQRDCNRILGLTAAETLSIVQALYEAKLSTYPRTDSRYITEDMEDSTRSLIQNILSSDIVNSEITGNYNAELISIKQIIDNSKVSDHHAIIPTSSLTKETFDTLPERAKSVLSLIIYRLFESVYTPYEYTATEVTLTCENFEFLASGTHVTNEGYKFITNKLNKSQERNSEANFLPHINKGDSFRINFMSKEEKQTQPPKLFNEDTLLSAMETANKYIDDADLKESLKNKGLGTPATRAGIIESIIAAGYVERKNKNLIATQKAYTLMDLLPEKIKNPEMTAEWEYSLNKISEGKYDYQQFIYEINAYIKELVNEFSTKEKNTKLFDSKIEIGKCPVCGSPVYEYPKCFSCSTGKNGDNFVIWKNIAGATISVEQAQRLLQKRKTTLIKKFKSKSGVSFDAYLILKDDNTISFEFPQKTIKKGRRNTR